MDDDAVLHLAGPPAWAPLYYLFWAVVPDRPGAQPYFFLLRFSGERMTGLVSEAAVRAQWARHLRGEARKRVRLPLGEIILTVDLINGYFSAIRAYRMDERKT